MNPLPPSVNLSRQPSAPASSASKVKSDLTDQPKKSPTVPPKASLPNTPDCLLLNTAEWLAEPDMLNLMQSGRRNYSLVNQYYSKKVKTTVRHTDYPGRLYRNPADRIESFLHLDDRGRDYLAALGIYYPLTEDIRSRKMSVAQARESISARRQILEERLNGTELTQQEKDIMGNPVFAEHFLCSRCDFDTALRLAGNDLHLFHSLTLQPLFRSGHLVPTDMEKLSGPGLRLLSDPLLSKLFQDGLISKQDGLNLTACQLESLLICRTLLLRRDIRIQEVLAIEPDDIVAIRKVGLLEELHDGRIIVALASEQSASPSDRNLVLRHLVQPDPDLAEQPKRQTLGPSGSVITLKKSELQVLLDRTPDRALYDALVEEEIDVAWIETIGAYLHHLPPERILEMLDISDKEDRSAFHGYTDGLNCKGVEKVALAYLQIYLNLGERLPAEAFLKIVQPFWEIFGWMVCEAFNENRPAILDRCARIWTLAQSKALVTGTDLDAIRLTVANQLASGTWAFRRGTMTGDQFAEFGRFLTVMDALDHDRLFRIWSHDIQMLDFMLDIDAQTVPSVDALLRPFKCFDPCPRYLNNMRVAMRQFGRK